MNRTLSTILAFICLANGVSTSNAVTLHWGSAAGSFLFECDGTTKADAASYTFELGTFAPSFTPDESNMADWSANWHTLDIGGYSSTTGRLAGSVSLLNTPAPDGSILDGNATDTASFFFGKDAYVWIYKGDNTTVDSTLEWNLLTNPDGDGSDPATAWTFPTAVESGAHTDVKEFALSDPGVTALFGEETAGSMTTTGAGEFAVTPTDPYTLQTFSIPEPSSTILALMGAAFLLGRRHRQRGSRGD